MAETAIKKTTVFRVTGLPNGANIEKSLRNAIKKRASNKSASTDSQKLDIEITILPSCYSHASEIGNPTKVALVDFKGNVPEFLSDPARDPTKQTTIEVHNEAVTFDRGFQNFTQLNEITDKIIVE